MASSILLLQPLTSLSSSSSSSSSPALLFRQNTHPIPSLKISTSSNSKPLTLSHALTESDSPKSIQTNTQTLLQELADCFDLRSDYFAQLPLDLRLDLNDAAFDLSNGTVIEQCGKELGEILLNLSRAWELADTSTSRTLANKLPAAESSLTDSAESGKQEHTKLMLRYILKCLFSSLVPSI